MVATPFLLSSTGRAFFALFAALGSGIIFIALFIYRLFLHPLARFPGPHLAGATHWYEVYYELIPNGGSQYAAKIRQLHAEYGPIVRITPNEVSVDDVDFHDKLYAPYPAVRHRDPNFTEFMGTNKGAFGTSGHYLHRQRRVAYNPFFASSNLSAAEPLMQEKINKMCALLWERRNTNLNIQTYLAALSLDSLFTMAFGSPLDLLDDLTSAEEFNMTVELLATSPPVWKLFPSIMPLAKRIPQSILRLLSRHIARLFDIHALILKEAQSFVEDEGHEKVSVSGDRSSPETLFSVIKRSKATEEEKAASRMAHEGTELFIGTYTSGRTMTTGLYYLQTNPEVVITLQDELKQAYPNPADEMSFKTLNNLPYLRAVVKEILRITFPVGCRVPLVCDEDISYNDWVIPAKSVISVNHRNLLFDPDVFIEPHKFRPDRWLDKMKPINAKKYFVVFGKGTRDCPGKDFATQLITMALASLVHRFEFEVSNEVSFSRDVAITREAVVVAPSRDSQGIKMRLVAARN